MTRSERLLTTVLTMPGRTTAEIAAHAGHPVRATLALLIYLEKQGWLLQRQERRLGTKASRIARWYASPKLEQDGYTPTYQDTAVLVERELLVHALSITELAARLGRPYETVRRAVRSLEQHGILTRLQGPDGLTFEHADTGADEAWEPKPFIHPIRARALGLVA